MEEHPQARFIVDTLSKAGFIAYYAGGWVRDYLLKHPSDDIDIATNAPPETIQVLFPHTVPIGIAFGIILVIIDGHEYEVATFRQDMDYHDGRRPSKIEFSSAAEDAKRRDFTINGMFYDPIQNKILDYVGGIDDLNKKLLRAIGNPHERIKEDRLRMIRAIRLSCRFHFAIEETTQDAIRAHAKELFPSVAIERIWQEFTKGYAFKKLTEMVVRLHEFGLLSAIFPILELVSVKEIEKRMAITQNYPENAPLIAWLLCLFPEFTVEEQIELCKRLKLSNPDVKFVSFLNTCQTLLLEHQKNRKSVSLWQWAHLYANRHADTCLKIAALHVSEASFSSILEDLSLLKKQLTPFTERIQKNNPVVKAEDLIAEGILPGKQLGVLLKEAEKISINEQIEDKTIVIAKLSLHNRQ